MESLVNQLILLIHKTGGAESVLADMIKQVHASKNNEKTWTPEEIDKTLKYVLWYNEYYGKADAIAHIDSMMSTYNISKKEIGAPENRTGYTSSTSIKEQELWPHDWDE